MSGQERGERGTGRIGGGERRPVLVAIVGGSGAGKSWLAGRLEAVFGGRAGRISLDSFYRDRSHLSMKRREGINFDHPRAIDWGLLEEVLRRIRAGEPAEIPQYDFKVHCRRSGTTKWAPKELVLVEGLWLLCRPAIRELFDLRIFLECDAAVRLKRRLARDQAERGRSAESICSQFQRVVGPMHERFVAPQKRYADLVLEGAVTEREVVKVELRISKWADGGSGLRIEN